MAPRIARWPRSISRRGRVRLSRSVTCDEIIITSRERKSRGKCDEFYISCNLTSQGVNIDLANATCDNEQTATQGMSVEVADMTVGEKMEQARIEAGLSREELAIKLGTSSQTIWRREKTR